MTPRPRILLVGDERADLAGIEAVLRREDAEVLTARGAGAALELLACGDTVAAVLDLERPDDRYRAAEALRARHATRALPLVFVVAGPHDPRVAFRGHDAGPLEYLSRPVDREPLALKVGALLAAHRLALPAPAPTPLRSVALPRLAAAQDWPHPVRARAGRRWRA